MARPNNPRTVYLDSNAFIGAINTEAGHEPITEVLRLCEMGKLRIAISMLSFVEVRGHGISRAHNDEDDREVIAQLSGPNIDKVEFSRRVALQARRLAMTYRLSNYDSVHLASAIDADADVLWTRDKDFKAIKGTRVEGVWVDEPYELGDPPLFTA